MDGQDPFAGVIAEMRRAARGALPPAPCLGRVLEAGKGRLVLRAAGNDLDGKDLLVCPDLGRGQLERATLTWVEGMNTTYMGTYTPPALFAPGGERKTDRLIFYTPGGYIQIDRVYRTLGAGDQVLLVPDEEGQTYYAVCKVVDPNDAAAAD